MTEVPRFDLRPNADTLIQQAQRWYSELPNPFYQPLGINIRGGSVCPVQCTGCSIDAQPLDSVATDLSKEKKYELLEQAANAGIISYIGSIGHAEPMLDLKFLSETIGQFQDKLDLSKINTSGITFSSVDLAKKQFKKLREAGFHNTRFLRPILAISLGMQQEKIPLKNIIYGIVACKEIFDTSEVGISISHYQTTKRYADLPETLRELYLSMTGNQLDDDVVVKSTNIRQVGRAKTFSQEEFAHVPMREIVDSRNCFDQYIGEYIQPTVQVLQNGTFITCPIFDIHKGLRVGILGEDTVKDAIIHTNNSSFFRAIAVGGLKVIFDEAVRIKPELAEEIVTTRHNACERLFYIFNSYPEVRAKVLELTHLVTVYQNYYTP